MGNYNSKNIDFSRQVLLQRLSRPQPAIAIYPQNSSNNTTLSVQIISNATAIAITYTSSSVVTESVTFVDKSLEQVVLELNQLGLPFRAVALTSIPLLNQGDFLPLGSNFKVIPQEFPIYDRFSGDGILLRVKKITVKHKDDSKIKVLPPYLEVASLPWYPRISNGSFTQAYKGEVYHFYIPEFDNQTWSSIYGKPFKDLKGAVPIAIDQNVYQLPRSPILWNGENITIYNGDIPISSNVIQDIDVLNGILYLNPEIELSDGFTIDYTYLENSYVYKDININGHFTQNPLLLDKFVIIYMIPIEGSIGAAKKTVFHVVGDSIEEAISSINLSDPSLPIAVIGAYNIQQIFSSDRVSILDTRVKGGGLKKVTGPTSPVHYLDNCIESKDVPIENRFDESSRFWDVGNYDGEAYPGAAAISIDLPIELQEVLSISDIKSKATKFVSAGVYPLMNFSSRDLPSVTGLSSQVSCAINLDLTSEFSKSKSGYALYNTITDFSGAGWSLNEVSLPSSLYTGNLSSINVDIPVIQSSDEYYLRVTSTGVHQSYLKGRPVAGISWEERDIIINSGNLDTPIKHSMWTKKRYFDKREVASGQLIKGYISFDPSNITKEYRNIQVNSPYRSDVTLKELLESSMSDIIDRTIELQPASGSLTNSTEIRYRHTDTEDSTQVETASDYFLVPSVYNSFYDFKDTPLEEKYNDLLYNIGYDFINHGLISQAPYFKYYIQNIGIYTGLTVNIPIIDYSIELKLLNKYLEYRSRRGLWSGDCTNAQAISTALTNKLMLSSGEYGSFGPGIPIYWRYLQSNTGLSGYYIETQAQLGGTISEVNPNYNYDIYYNTSLPTILSNAISHSGSISTDTLSSYTNAINISIDQTINTIESGLNHTRTYSGQDISTHWYANHGRLSTYLGATLHNLIEGYTYIYDYLSSQDITNVTIPTGVSYLTLRSVFSGIERVLEAGYEGLYNNLLRGGVVDSDTAYSLYGYGWYLNNWKEHYGLVSKLYETDHRDKYSDLFDKGLKVLVKNHFTNSNDFYETTYLNNEMGPFSVNTPTKILHPLSEAVKYSSEWSAITQGVVTTLVNSYGVDGLYYIDPTKEDKTPGKQYEVLKGLSRIYSAIASTGSSRLWEPIANTLSSLRGANYLPVYSSHAESMPTPTWIGTINSLNMWKYMHTGDLRQELNSIKECGINAVRIPFDYFYWKNQQSDFYSKVDQFLEYCNELRLRVIPVIYTTEGTSLATNQITDYETLAVTGTYSNLIQLSDSSFLTGSLSGEGYLSGVIDRFDSNTALLAWDIGQLETYNQTALSILNSSAYYIKQLTDTPIIASLKNPFFASDSVEYALDLDASPVSFGYVGDTNNTTSIVSNPNYDYIGIQPQLFNSYIDILSGDIAKNIILTNLGEATYNDYAISVEYALRKEIPFVISNIMLPNNSLSGVNTTTNGILYPDNTCRSIRQLLAIKNSAQSFDVLPSGNYTQRRSFTSHSFYETGYLPSYTIENAIDEVSSWSSRTIVDPLLVGNTGEFYRQRHVLVNIQSGLDSFNHLNNATYPSLLYSDEEARNLNKYRVQWTSGDFVANISNRWTIDDELDSNRYSEFFTEWGTYLYALINRHNLNG